MNTKNLITCGVCCRLSAWFIIILYSKTAYLIDTLMPMLAWKLVDVQYQFLK